jgi:hypothetical protein
MISSGIERYFVGKTVQYALKKLCKAICDVYCLHSMYYNVATLLDVNFTVALLMKLTVVYAQCELPVIALRMWKPSDEIAVEMEEF